MVAVTFSNMAIQNVTRQKLTLKKRTVVATVSAANVVSPMLAPKLGMYSDIPKYEGSDYLKGRVPEYATMYLCHPSTTNPSKLELTNEQSNKLFRSLDLSSVLLNLGQKMVNKRQWTS